MSKEPTEITNLRDALLVELFCENKEFRCSGTKLICGLIPCPDAEKRLNKVMQVLAAHNVGVIAGNSAAVFEFPLPPHVIDALFEQNWHPVIPIKAQTIC